MIENCNDRAEDFQNGRVDDNRFKFADKKNSFSFYSPAELEYKSLPILYWLQSAKVILGVTLN
jgi:hypothetical protein